MNQFWSQTDKKILEMILKDWNLTNRQQSILNQQIQYFESPSELFKILLNAQNNWFTLQENIKEFVGSETLSHVNKSSKINFQQEKESLKTFQNQPKLESQQYPRVSEISQNNQSTNYIQVNQQVQQKQITSVVKPFKQNSQMKNQESFQDQQNSKSNNLSQGSSRLVNYFPTQDWKVEFEDQDSKNNSKGTAQKGNSFQNQSFYSQNKNSCAKSLFQQNYTQNLQTFEEDSQILGNSLSSISGKTLQQSPYEIKELKQNRIKSVAPQISKDYFTLEARKEFENLNKQNYSNIFQLIDMVFQILFNGQDEEKRLKFSQSGELTVDDLVSLCIEVQTLFSYYPRAVQLISVVILYNHKSNSGRLAQIYTGEGKTLIVAMLAVLLCKKKNFNIDIVTSSPVLAERDSKEYEKFYKTFGLTVSHNIHKNQIIKDGVLPCYNCQIIYGDSASFQGDILRHEYSEQGTMGNRKQQYAIIDEVDSMLIDGHRNKTLLSTPIPGMLDLSKVLQLIWDEICKVEPSISTNFEVMIVDNNDYYSVSLEEYIEQTLNKQLKDYVKEFIPSFRLNYINHMKNTWIKNAIQAKFYLKQNKDYVIQKDQVRIVDYQNTGVISSGNTQWEKGLHQFIQLKHNLNVTALNISTNYLSNISFFKRYKEKLLGLTGTLGSLNTQNLLAKQYNVDFIFVPPFKKRNIQEELGQALSTEEEWIEAMEKAVSEKMQKKRAVLIINKTILEADKLESALKKKHKKIIKYTDDSQVISKDVDPQTIIIATNLAGRGTDFITNKELEENGGLHVILSFLPKNIRTQEQGFGRTCRQGKKGSAQLIVQFKQNLYQNPDQEFETLEQAIEFYIKQTRQSKFNLIDVLKFYRDQNEKYYMEQIEQEMATLLNEDKCFEKFCQIAKKKVNFKQNRQAFRSLEEKWGIYIEMNQEKGIQVNEIEQFLNQEENSNPKYLILEAIQQNDLNKIKKADQEKKDPQAQYYKGMIEINNEKYKEGAQSLLQAKQLFLDKIDNEREFASAVRINQQQIQYFSNDDEFQEKKKDAVKLNTFEQQQSCGIELVVPERIENNQEDKKVNQTQDRIGEKVENQIKVYQKVIDNIDDTINTLKTFNPEKEEIEFEWIKVIDQEEKKPEQVDSALKHQQDVINDGPLPRLGSIKKKEKETSFWEYTGLFLLGCCEFALGAYLNTHFCGAVIPIAKSLMKEGISDMTLALTCGLKGLDIDWKSWGQKKVVEACAAVCRSGVCVAREKIEEYKQRQLNEKQEANVWKTLQKESIDTYLNKITPKGAMEYYKKCQKYLTDQQKQQIENTKQTIEKVQEFTLFNLSTDEMCKMAADVIDDQVLLGAISSKTGSEISQIFNNQVTQSSETKADICEGLINMGQKYLRAEIVKKKAEQMQIGNNEEVIQHSQNLCKAKHEKMKNQIEDFKTYQQRLTNELNHFSQIFWNCYKQDEDLNKRLVTMDLYLELLCDLQEAMSKTNDSNVQQVVRQQFNMNNISLQQACKNLKISNKASMIQFYNEQIKPRILNLLQEFYDQNQITEPLEIMLKKQISIYSAKVSSRLRAKNQELEQKECQIRKMEENLNYKNIPELSRCHDQLLLKYNQECDQLRTSLKQFNEMNKQPGLNQVTKDLITYLVQKKMIQGNGVSLAANIRQESKDFLNNRSNNPLLHEIFQEAMIKSCQQLPQVNLTSKKIFSTLLRSSIDLQVLDPIKKFIFQSRLQDQDKQILQNLN